MIHVSDDLIARRVVAPRLDAYFDELARSLDARDRPPPPAPAAPPSEAPPPDLWRFALRITLAALFWVAAYHAVTVRTAPWIGASVALWVVWFIVRRAHARA